MTLTDCLCLRFLSLWFCVINCEVCDILCFVWEMPRILDKESMISDAIITSNMNSLSMYLIFLSIQFKHIIKDHMAYSKTPESDLIMTWFHMRFHSQSFSCNQIYNFEPRTDPYAETLKHTSTAFFVRSSQCTQDNL